MAEMIKSICPWGEGGGQKQASEHKAIQQLKNFGGDRSKFRKWNENLLNALGQVNVKNRRAFKYLNAKFHALDGALQDQDDDDMARTDDPSANTAGALARPRPSAA